MGSARFLIPKRRLQYIPRPQRRAHEYCYFLHDQCVHLLAEYEKEKAHYVSVNFQSEIEAKAFASLAETDSIAALRATGYPNEARRVIINAITLAMVSDCLHHIFEALKCFEKRKSVVSLNLLRKPLLDSLTYLSWMFGDEDAFYAVFSSGDPNDLTLKKLGNRRLEIIEQALCKTDIGGLLDANFIKNSIFDVNKKDGLYGLLQHAVHLITVDRIEIKTTPENFNFIFKSNSDNDIYEHVYRVLPNLMLYLSHVIFGLFGKMKPIEEGAKTAFVIRSIFGFCLIKGGRSRNEIRKVLKENLSPYVFCSKCKSLLSVTPSNAYRIVLTESFFCTHCRRIEKFPFSWIF
jgi:hypothetical protein